MNPSIKAHDSTILEFARKQGRFIFALVMFAFGIQHFIFVISGEKTGLGPPWTPAPPVAALLTGAVMVIAALCIAWKRYAREAAIVLGAVILIRALIVTVPALVANVHDPHPWTSGFELLAMCAASWTLSATSMLHQFSLPKLTKTPNKILENIFDSAGKSGPYFFAISLPVFGVQHFLYAAFIATLIPQWIPLRLFWAYFVGVAFCITFLCILSRKLASLSATWLSIMFFLWFLILHSPRVIASPHKQNEWTSAFVALAMAGAAWIVANAESKQS